MHSMRERGKGGFMVDPPLSFLSFGVLYQYLWIFHLQIFCPLSQGIVVVNHMKRILWCHVLPFMTNVNLHSIVVITMLSSFNVDESTTVSLTSLFIILFMLQVSWNVYIGWWWTSTQATQGESFGVFVTEAGLFIGCQASPSGSGTLFQLAQGLTEALLALFQVPPWDKSTRRISFLAALGFLHRLLVTRPGRWFPPKSGRCLALSLRDLSLPLSRFPLCSWHSTKKNGKQRRSPHLVLACLALVCLVPGLPDSSLASWIWGFPIALRRLWEERDSLLQGFRVCRDCLLCIIVFLMWRVGDLLLRGECSPLLQSRRNKLQFWRQLLVVLRQPLLPFIWEISPTGIWIPYP